jgi:hypothetical protein
LQQSQAVHDAGKSFLMEFATLNRYRAGLFHRFQCL